jgi:hypothetical protein
MDTTLTHSLTRLETDQLMRVHPQRGQCLVVFSGRVWLTQDGDIRDHVLKPGASFAFDRTSLVLVQALEPAYLSVLEPQAAPEPIGYEAAWPAGTPAQQTWPALAAYGRARELRARTQRAIVRRTALAVWRRVAAAASFVADVVAQTRNAMRGARGATV